MAPLTYAMPPGWFWRALSHTLERPDLSDCLPTLRAKTCLLQMHISATTLVSI